MFTKSTKTLFWNAWEFICFNGKIFIVGIGSVHYTVYSVHCTVYTLCTVQFRVYIIYNVYSYSIHCIIYPICYTNHTHCEVYNVYYIIYPSKCIIYSV